MTSPIEIMSETEIARCRAADPESGFGALRTERGALPLEAMKVDAQIDGLIAEVTVSQTFINTIGEPMEATYIFPLPDRAAVTSFRMEVAGRVIDGIIEERERARDRYDQAIARGHRAAITEEERSGVFTMRVGNIMPNERATVRLTLTGPLPYDQGEATFRFPLVVAPRYIPGAPLGGQDAGSGVAFDTVAVPDASRISPPVLLPGFPNPVRLELTAELRDGDLAPSQVRSSLHAVMERRESGAHTVRIHAGERLDRDFILRFSLAREQVHSTLALKPDDSGDEGTFLLTLIPPAALPRSAKPRDVVFVLDRSGSMEGWKMVAARRAVARIVDTLRDRDRFTVLAFDESIETPDFGAAASEARSEQGERRGVDGLRPAGTPSLVDATDRNRFRAVEFLAGIESRGGTEMFQPLDDAAGRLAGGYQDRERAIVLVTDGQVGNEDQILRMLGVKLKNVRVFCVGIDLALNGAFLKRMADLGGGHAEFVESEERLDEVMDRIHRRIGAPVLTELSLTSRDLGLDPRSIAPHRLPDLFAGAPVVIGGRYRGRSNGSVQLAGSDASGSSWSSTIGGQESRNRAITSVWARARVRDLEDRYVLSRDPSLERELVSTSIRFSVLCRFTAFVAVDEAERVNLREPPREVMQPVELPQGWAQAPTATKAGTIRQRGFAKEEMKKLRSPMQAEAKRDVDGFEDPSCAAPRAAPAPACIEAMEKDWDDFEQVRRGKPMPIPSKKPRPQERPDDLVERVRAESDPQRAVELLAAELPRTIADLRAKGNDAERVRELEALLDDLVLAIRAGTAEDELRGLITRALELLDPKAGGRRAFWR